MRSARRSTAKRMVHTSHAWLAYWPACMQARHASPITPPFEFVDSDAQRRKQLKKLKADVTKTSEVNMAAHVSSTLFIRNLPYSASKDDLETLFENYGPIKQCFVVTEKGVKDKCRGFGYVTFAVREDAEKAIKTSKSLEGRKLKVDFANKKPKRVKELPGGTPAPWSNEKEKSNKEQNDKPEPKHSQIEKKGSQSPPPPKADKKNKKNKTRNKKVKEELKLKEAEREKRKCRLIVRNLPFKCSKEDLKSAFEKFGDVSEVIIPVNEKTSKKRGFGFVQFEALKGAAKALKHMNGKEIMGRVVAVDWTLPWSEYHEAVKKTTPLTPKEENRKNNKKDEETKDDSDEEDESSDEMDNEMDSAIKENDGEMDVSEEEEIGDDDDEEDDVEEDVKKDEEEEEEEDEVKVEEEEDEDDEDEDDDDEDDGDEDDEDEEEGKEQRNARSSKQRPEDVHEGKTLFIRNVPFDSVDEDIEEIFSPFGELELCRVVMDPMTEHSKGTAFVKFSNKEDADRCLQETGVLRLNGRPLNINPAISRSEAVRLRTVEKEKAKEEQKDKRNLHLLREGMIRPGTKAAEGLSELYLNKRLKVENLKKEKLKNLNVFVSPTRLAIHNLPKAVDDKRLKEIAREAAGDKRAKIIESRIMKDLNSPNASGVCKSLGFGFVEFTQHEHALKALNHINNNAELFGPDKRPIVGFSLENKRALEMKEKRRDKAKMKQEMFSHEAKPRKEEYQQRKPYSQQRLQQQTQQQQRGQTKTDAETHLHGKSPMVMPQEGKKKGLPRHFGAKNRWRDRGKVADEKRMRRKDKRMVLQRQVWRSMKDPRPEGGLQVSRKELKKEKQKNQKKKQGRGKREEKQFNALVSKYKQKLTRTSGPGDRKASSKWFDT